MLLISEKPSINPHIHMQGHYYHSVCKHGGHTTHACQGKHAQVFVYLQSLEILILGCNPESSLEAETLPSSKHSPTH